MHDIKKKLLDELISKLSGMEDPLMGDSEESEEEEPAEGSVKVVKVEAEPMSEEMKDKLKKKLMGE